MQRQARGVFVDKVSPVPTDQLAGIEVPALELAEYFVLNVRHRERFRWPLNGVEANSWLEVCGRVRWRRPPQATGHAKSFRPSYLHGWFKKSSF